MYQGLSDQQLQVWMQAHGLEFLTKLDLVLADETDCANGREILRNVPLLRDLVLKQAIFAELEREHFNSLVAPWREEHRQCPMLQLRSLRLTDLDCDHAHVLGHAVDFNELTRLMLDECFKTTQFTSWLGRHAQLKLESLCIWSGESPADFNTFLRSFSSLKSLELVRVGYDLESGYDIDCLDAIKAHGQNLRELEIYDAIVQGYPGNDEGAGITKHLGFLGINCPKLRNLSIGAPPLPTHTEENERFRDFIELLKPIHTLDILKLESRPYILDAGHNAYIQDAGSAQCIIQIHARQIADDIFSTLCETSLRALVIVVVGGESHRSFGFLRHATTDPWGNKAVLAWPIELARLRCEEPGSRLMNFPC
jgi:hypothetical protein